MPRTIGPLGTSDELLNHQTVNTFATAGTSDLGWTEKIWSTFVRRDGSLQVDFGLGKYVNRNVIDGFGGIARGDEQWTVRASRELDLEPDRIGVGPLDYEIVDGLRRVRVRLGANDVLPLRFELTFDSVMPPFFEDRDVQYDKSRMIMDVIRFHQCGSAEGWIDIDGERIEVRPDEWFALRDRSWGVRQYVGVRPPDLQVDTKDWLAQRFHFNWCPAMLERPDGTRYELHYYFRDTPAGSHLTGHINEADGTQQPIRDVVPDLRYDEQTRDLLGGRLTMIMDDRARTTRVFEIEPLSRTGFRLWPALYYPWKGLTHGTWKGPLHVDGERIENCPAEHDPLQEPIWQTRDRAIRISEGDAHGYGIVESSLIGDWPEYVTTSAQATATSSR